MKLFITILLVALFVGGGYLAFLKIKSIDTSSHTELNVSITGTVSKVSNNNEYSYSISEGAKMTGINSSRLDLSKYVNKKITVTGQYSGSTLYVDRIEEYK